MTTLANFAAETYPYWREPAVAVLALLVIALLLFASEVS